MTDSAKLEAGLALDLDSIAERAGGALARGRLRDGFRRGLRTGLKLMPIVPAAGLIHGLAAYSAGVAPLRLPVVVLCTLLTPLLVGGAAALLALARRPGRRALLGLVDDRLGLSDRLVAADEFLGLGERGPFHEAALRDASRLTRGVKAAEFDFHTDEESVLAPLARVLPLALLLLVVAALVRGIPGPLDPSRMGGGEEELAAVDPAGEEPAAEDEPVERPLLETPEAPERPPRSASAQTEGSRSEATELDPDEKPSSGKASPGKGGEAKGSSGASQARGAPTGQTPESKEPDKRRKKEGKRREEKESDEPEKVKKPAEEDSGSTAGKGSSRGSNKNPTTSSWTSKDQVSTDDDAEVEDDTDSEDEDEEQENRGGVQPSMRDRRPPVSRDLQIGFGNRPNPDANGRGGPSQPKKSRGVASLVLGVPIPDRVKGRPGPGRTKITQERVEPESEEAPPGVIEARTPRAGPSGGPPPLDLDPITRAVVRSYFLRQRQSAPQ